MSDRLEKGLQENPALREACETKDVKDLMEGKRRDVSLEAYKKLLELTMAHKVKMGDGPRDVRKEYGRICRLIKSKEKIAEASTLEDVVLNLPDFRQEEAPNINWNRKLKQVQERLQVKFHEDYKKILFQFGEFAYDRENCYFFCPETVEHATEYCRKSYRDFPVDGYVFDIYGKNGFDMEAVFLQKEDGSIHYYMRSADGVSCIRLYDDLFSFMKSRCGIEV